MSFKLVTPLSDKSTCKQWGWVCHNSGSLLASRLCFTFHASMGNSTLNAYREGDVDYAHFSLATCCFCFVEKLNPCTQIITNVGPLCSCTVFSFVVLVLTMPSFTLGHVSFIFSHPSTSKHGCIIPYPLPCNSSHFLPLFRISPLFLVRPHHFYSVYCLLNEVDHQILALALLSSSSQTTSLNYPAFLWRGWERPRVAEYEINIHDKPLKPQNYCMSSTLAELCHWKKYQCYSIDIMKGFCFPTKNGRQSCDTSPKCIIYTFVGKTRIQFDI